MIHLLKKDMLKKECFHHQCLSYRKGLIITMGALTLTSSDGLHHNIYLITVFFRIPPGHPAWFKPVRRNSAQPSSWSQKNCIAPHRKTHWKDNSRWPCHMHILHMLKLSRPAGGTTLLMLFEKVSQKPENYESHNVDPERRAVDVGRWASCICAVYGVYLHFLVWFCHFFSFILTQ